MCILYIYKLTTPIVNVTELFQYHKIDIVAVGTADIAGNVVGDTVVGDMLRNAVVRDAAVGNVAIGNMVIVGNMVGNTVGNDLGLGDNG